MDFKYELIFDECIYAITEGIFLPMKKLPSLRKMAIKYNCALSVVIQAYSKLEALGLITSKEKSGYFVSKKSKIEIPKPESINHTLLPNLTKANIMTAEMFNIAMDKSILPLGVAIPDESVIATKKLVQYISRKIKSSPELLTIFTPASGSLNLRKEIVKYMFNKDVFVNVDDIVITNGCSEALYISLKIITKPGDTVAIETPSFFSLISILKELKLRVIEIPTRSIDGLDLDILKIALSSSKIKALIFSSTIQNPLCSIMKPNTLIELYQISIDFDFILIEDDIYGDCSFTNKVYKPLKHIDKFNRVIYCSSFSKTLSPGIRIGWAIPGDRLKQFRETKNISDLGGPAFVQESLADFLKDGCYDLHIKSFRKKIYAQTYGIRKLIEQYFPSGIKVTKPEGGYFLWIEFPKGFDSYNLYKAAYDKKIGIAPGAVFSVSGNYINCIRISCSSRITDKVIEGIKQLGELSKKLF